MHRLPGLMLALTAAHLLLPATTLAQAPRRPPGAIAPPDAEGARGIGTPAAAKPPEIRPVISFKDGRLTVHVQNQPLDAVLEGISRRAPVAIVRVDGVGSERVSLKIQDVPLEEALRQILVAHDTFLFYGVEKEAPASLRAVWVYPGRKGRGLAPLPPEAWASAKEMLIEARTNPDAIARGRAVETLVARKGEQARELVLEALADRDEDVRAYALHAALGRGVPLPSESLASLALTDPSHNVRFLALEALSSDPNVRVVAQQALGDIHPDVRAKAQEILDRLDAAATPRVGSPSGQSPARRPRR